MSWRSFLGIELGDAELLKTYSADKFLHKSGGASGSVVDLLSAASEPSVIPAIATYLVAEEPTNSIQVEDVSHLRPSVAATSIILSVLKKSAHFDHETRRWAHEEFYAPIGRERSRSLVRAFWSENAQHFAAKYYQAVRPPRNTSAPSLGPKTSAPAIPAIARPPAKRVQSGTGTNRTTTVSATSTLAVTPAPVTPPFAARWPWLLLAIGTGGGWLWWRSRH